MTVKVTGLDLSMTATGVTWGDLSMTATGVTWDEHNLPSTWTIRSSKPGDLRLAHIADKVVELAADSKLVLIEGYLNHSHTAGITGMVHGAVRLDLQRAGLKYATLPPTSLKKFATGRGNASKTDMAVAALKRGDREFKDDNQCDSWWLWVAARQYLGDPVFPLPKAQVDALSALKMEV